MVNGWNGDDPTTQSNEPGVDYELATRFLANNDVVISGVRVYTGASEAHVGRDARIWSSGGTELAVVDIDDTLTPGWVTYNLSEPLSILTGATFYVSYSTTRYYMFSTNAYPVTSSDGSLTANAGRFNNTPEVFPDTATTTFYGIDVVFTLGGNLPPTVTGISVVKDDLDITATATVDDETPATVSLKWDWGDDSSTTTGAGVTSSNHTYALPGTYALMVTATDGAGLKDSHAVVVTVTEATTPGANEAWVEPIFDAVVSDWQATGFFSRVNQHQPRKKPGTKLEASIWLQSIRPVGAISGLAASSGVLVFIGRMYLNTGSQQEDMIDPLMMRAASSIFRRYHDDFDFDLDHLGVRNVDFFGMTGIGVSVTAGYLEQDRAQFRVYDMVIPVIVNDIWRQTK